MMKKLMAILLAAMMMLTLSLPVLAEETASEATASLGGETLGGWTVNKEDTTQIPDEVKACFDKATEGLLGCTYEPVALLSSQIVSGTNYCLLCRCTLVGAEPVQSYVMMYLHQGLDGTSELMNIQTIVFTAIPTNE